MSALTPYGFWFARKQRGSISGEYGLLVALVALAGIPALMLLGNQFSTVIEQSASSSTSGKLFALLDSKADSGIPAMPGQVVGAPVSVADPVGVAEANTGFDPLKGFDSLSVGQNPDGTFKFTLPDGSSIATNATSVEGTVSKLMADQLIALAESTTLPDGTPVDSALKAHLTRLANIGYNLGDHQDAYVAGDTARFDSIAEGLATFNQEYAALVNNPAYGLAITAFVEKPSGVITNVAYRNFGFGYNTQVTVNGKYYDFNSFNPKGYVFAGNAPLELSGLITDEAAEEIENADQNI